MCPIMHAPMQDPVQDPEGNTFERSAIEAWVREHHTSPLTRTHLELGGLTANRALRDAIAAVVTFASPLTDEPETTTIATANAPAPPAPVPLTLFTTEGNDSNRVRQLHASVSAPDTRSTPTDVVIVIDESGSMGARAVVASARGESETDGLTVMDIVKHGARTMVHTLGEADRVAIVGFTDVARVVQGWQSTTPEGKEHITRRVNDVHPKRTTNLWDGVDTALQMIANRDDKSRHPTVILLTDGVPNIRPPRGELAMLRKYKDQHFEGTLPTIHMFGFGYEMESELLTQMATEAHGLFTFIPDASFVGTAFVHAVANLRTACATNVRLRVEFDDGTLDPLCLPHTRTSWGAEVALGAVYQGQTRDVVCTFRGGSAAPNVSLVYTPVSGGTEITTDAVVVDQSTKTTDALTSQCYRQQVVEMLGTMTTADANVQGLSVLAQSLTEQLKQACATRPGHEYLKAMHQEVSDQVSKAVSIPEWYQRWGRHYLRAVRCAHLNQQCTNFKDPGQQHYGGVLFKDGRDDADEAFLRLPPPTPSASRPPATRGLSGVRAGVHCGATRGGATRGGGSPTAVFRSLSHTVDMSRYHDAAGSCFAGDGQVARMDGTTTRVDAVRRGDVLVDGRGAAVTVVCVLETRLPVCTVITTLSTGLRVTPWHPVCVNGTWAFPCQVDGAHTAQDHTCHTVYSLLVERDGQWADTVVIDNTVCIALAHGRTDSPVLTHAFYGTDAVVRALQEREGWEHGLVSVVGARVPRGPDGLVCGLSALDTPSVIEVLGDETEAYDSDATTGDPFDETNDSASEDEGLESGTFLVHGECQYADTDHVAARRA